MSQFPLNNYNSFVAVAPDDNRTLVTLTHKKAHAIYVGTSGDLVLVGSDGTQATFKSVPSGTLLPIHAVQVRLTGTTATNIVALYSVPRA